MHSVHSQGRAWERLAVALLLCAFFGICAAVAATALQAAPSPLALLPLAIALGLSPVLARRLPRALDGLLRAHPLLSVLWLALAALAVARIAGVALFMADPQQPQLSAIWYDPFYVNHSCFSSYWKASELASAGASNIYDSAHYAGNEGRFKLDEYLYPPPFLILPQLAASLGAGFVAMRAVWFAVDAALVAAIMLAVCAWIGGATGRRAALLLPAAWLALPTLITMQTGNFQLAAIALALLAMLLFQRGSDEAGGAVMALALFKIFPGVLCAYLLFCKRWRALAWSIAFSLLYAALAYAMLGAQPFRDFVGYEMPRIASGEVWSWMQLEGLEAVVAINYSVPALVLKLKLFGVDGIEYRHLAAVALLWSVVVVALAWLASRRASAYSRLELAAVWLGLLGLAAVRSPFVPDDYALFPALWLWCLLAAGQPSSQVHSGVRTAMFGVLWLAFAIVMPIGLVQPQHLPLLLAVSTVSQLLALAFWLWPVLRRPAAMRSAPSNPSASPAAA